jgi:hypothetical protein
MSKIFISDYNVVVEGMRTDLNFDNPNSKQFKNKINKSKLMDKYKNKNKGCGKLENRRGQEFLVLV